MTTGSPAVTRRPVVVGHDIVVGFLSGLGVGAVAGLYLNRLVENNVVVLACALLSLEPAPAF